MDRTAIRTAPHALGLLLTLLLLVSILSAGRGDPSLLNLFSPRGGPDNLLGLPGALVGGSLVDLLGSAALAVPLLLFNWNLTPRNRPPWPHYTARALGLLLVLAAGLGLWLPAGPAGLLGAGLLGRAGGDWVAATLGPWPGGALLALATLHLARGLVYVESVRSGARDARLFAGFLGARAAAVLRGAAGVLRRGGDRLGAGATALLAQGQRRMARQGQRGGQALHDGLAALWGALSGGPPSIARVKAGRARHGRAALPTVVAPAPAPAAADGFDDWFGAVAAGEPPAAAPAQRPHPREPAPAAAAPPTAKAPPQDWSEGFRRYQDNLDLDWERVLRHRNAGREGPPARGPGKRREE